MTDAALEGEEGGSAMQDCRGKKLTLVTWDLIRPPAPTTSTANLVAHILQFCDSGLILAGEE